MSKYSERRNSQFMVRYSDELHAMLMASAKAYSRSINAEIVHRLERSFEPSISIAPEIQGMLDQYVEARVGTRLREIASQIGAGK